MLSKIVVLTLILGLTYGQLCPGGAPSTGPCAAGLPCPSGQTCINGNCCPANAVTTTTTAACVDKVNPQTGRSDCAANAYLCNNNLYYTLMTQQCPKTCGRCNGGGTPPSSNCVDQVNPQTGTSDCPSRAYLCNNNLYYTLMTQQCPKTCGRCSS